VTSAREWVWHPPDDADAGMWLAWANQLPLCAAVGLECVELDPTHGLFRLDGTPIAANPNGSVNGGVIAAIADQAMGVMAMRGARHGHQPATAALNVQFHSPAYAPLTMEAHVVGGGRRVRFVEVVVFDRDGQRCCTSHGTMVVSRPAEPVD
jgi:uncharacterized protein (TIGR00369 family)